MASAIERRMKLLNDIHNLNADETKTLVKKRRDEGGWTRQYRASLSKVYRFFEGVNLNEAHLQCLKNTPFYHMVLPFVMKRLSYSSIRGAQTEAITLFMTYNKDRKAFHVGGRYLTITPRECDLIFGLVSGRKQLKTKRTNLASSALARRKFSTYEKIKPMHLKDQLMLYINSGNQQDIEDTVRLIVLHLLTNFFFVMSGDVVNAWMFKLCDNLNTLCQYNWGAAIVDCLMKSVHKKTAECIRGCTPLILYWICERTTLVEPVRIDAFPRFRKWRMKFLKDALSKVAIKDIRPDQVSNNPIVASEKEQSILSGKYAGEYLSEEELYNAKNEESDSDESQGFNDNMHVSHTNGEEGPSTSTKRRHVDVYDGPNTPALYEHITQLTKTNQILVSQLVCTRKDVELWRSKAQKLESNNKEFHDQLEKMSSLLSTEAHLAKEVDRLQKQLFMEQQVNANLRADLAKMKDENENLHTDAASFATDAEELKAQITMLRTSTEWKVASNEELKPPCDMHIAEDNPQHQTHLNYLDDMPSFDLLTPTQCTPDLPLTIMPTADLRIIDLTTDLKLLKDKEEVHIRTLEQQAMKLKDLSDAVAEHHKTTVDNQPNSRFDLNGAMIAHIEDDGPVSVVSKRTRSKKSNVTPFERNTLLDIGKSYKRYSAYKNLNEDYRTLVNVIANSAEKHENTLWQSEDKSVCVLVSDIFACIQNQCISNLVIDSYGKIMSLHQDNGDFGKKPQFRLKGKSLFFPSWLLGSIRNNPDHTFTPPAEMDKSRYLLFPILHICKPKERGQDHWTLLVLDRFSGVWSFYNSMRPRKGTVDNYIADARELKDVVDRVAEKYNLDFPSKDEEIVSVSDAPQQKNGTVDCGVVVLYIIKRIFEQQPIVKSEAEKEIPKMRKEIVEALLEWGRDEDYSKKKKMKVSIT